MIKLHIYRKKIIKPHYYADARAIPVFLDDKPIGDMNPGDNIITDIAPGPHKIVIKAPGFLMAPVTKEFTVDENSTDVHVAFRGRLGKYIEPMIFELIQYNAAELLSREENSTKITVCSEDMSLKMNIWYMVTVDDRMVGTMDGNSPSLVFNTSKGKHLVVFEALHEIGYAIVNVKDDCDSMYVLVNNCEVLDVRSHIPQASSSARQVKCVFTRSRQFKGCAGTTKIIIDGSVKVDLKNGETKETYLSEGNHSLLIKCNRIETKDFVVPENSNKVTFNIEDVDDIRSIVVE